MYFLPQLYEFFKMQDRWLKILFTSDRLALAGRIAFRPANATATLGL